MSEQSDELHRRLGAELFNRAWALIDKAGRDNDDDIEMLLAAAASRWHWGQAEVPEKLAVGDWQVAHVAALLGYGELARLFARHNLDLAIACGWDGWRLASAHEGMARAFAVMGDRAGREHHIGLAEAALEREPDKEERSVIAAQVASVPKPPLVF